MWSSDPVSEGWESGVSQGDDDVVEPEADASTTEQESEGTTDGEFGEGELLGADAHDDSDAESDQEHGDDGHGDDFLSSNVT
jgi:hypothetical protein